MSNFRSKAFNPASKRVEDAEYCDNYYGQHRYGIRFDDGCFHPEAQCGIDAAATAIDSLRNEINDLANEVARYKSYAEKFDEENAALQARVKELEGVEIDARLAMLDVTRLQQERDEAIAALNAILSVNDDFRAGLPQDWEGDQLQDACDAARDLVRRLAGPEKIAAASDGEERSSPPEGKI